MGLDLEQLGRDAAAARHAEEMHTGWHTSRALQHALREIAKAHGRMEQWVEQQQHVPQAVEWLLDNWYLIQREGNGAVEALRGARALRGVRGARSLYLMELAGAAVEADPQIIPEVVAAFLAGVQQGGGLTEVELSLWVTALKGALVLRLAKICAQLEEHAEHLGETVGTLITALRTLSAANLTRMLEEASQVERMLRQDPAGQYSAMEDATRARYRHQLCRLARKHRLTETAAAARVLELCRDGEEHHVGYYLFRQPLGRSLRQRTGVCYVASVLLPTLFLVLLLGFLLHSWVVTLLLLLPVSDIAKNLVDFIVVRLFRPRPVHRMALETGIPPEGRTLCVIAGLLTDEHSGEAYAALLERYRLANRDGGDELLFGILADLPDRELPMGSQAARWVAKTEAAIDGLNQKYGGGFYLFFRPPIFHPVDERYRGWERKRGALIELVRLLKGRKTGLTVAAGTRAALDGVRYIITLDSDTSLNVGVARELVGAMLHPLNRAVIDPRRNIVISGYGLLQPRVGVELSAANRSQFARIFAGQGGVDPYGSTTSDVYHDLFDAGTYTGKGIFDVDAFYTCLEGRFPENRVLSHDLLEGAYLHAGLVGDVELTDGYPYKVTSYFARLHRWVRGDWQLLPWLGQRVKTQAGVWERNPISGISKWKIFDNLRRSLSPLCTLLALLLGMCLTGADFGAAAALAVLAAASNLLLSGAELAARGGKGIHARYHSTIIAGLGGAMLQTLVQLLFLPVHAWISTSAIGTALWRQMVTHRALLAWVTAADVEKGTGGGVADNYRRLWPTVVVGVVAMLFSRFPAGAAVGLVWVLSPCFSWALSRPISETREITVSDRAFLLHEGALIWRYFDQFLRAEDHWLPPDNVQEQPDVGVARRTSPTNIGMALLCCLAAADLDLATRARAKTLISHMLDTLEGLEKWHGHLYNWYDTASGDPLYPRYVSSVDSGNLCASLIALREGLYEWDEGALARRAEVLSDGMEFAVLFDRERKLFVIGYDREKEELTQGWYDLMASEARQTSYLAVARGEVEPRHWRRLGRMLVGENDYSGMASWTGTMFEYFMPNLLMPVEHNSLQFESLAFCLYEQKRRGGKCHVPWGISESGFYAFDGALNYQYKAHGVQKLGLKRGLDDELVVAPYASFLALLIAPSSAGRNLRRLRDMGAEGRFGLYEALDFTHTRLGGSQPFEVVRSYMSHHLGMSLLAIDNVLRGSIMQKRFMRDCAMGAYRELLQERVPVGATVIKHLGREIPEKPKRFIQAGLVRVGAWSGTGRPACHLVSNGSYTVLCAADGWSRAQMETMLITTGRGISFWLKRAEGLVPLSPTSYRFDGGAQWTVEGADFVAELKLSVSEGTRGEVRTIALRNTGDRPLAGELVCYLEPVLAAEGDYLAHPGFSKLFLESGYTGSGVVFSRRARKMGEHTPVLAVLWDAPGATFDTARELALGRGGLRALEQALERPAHSSAGAVLDPCLLLRIPVQLNSGDCARFKLSLCTGGSSQEVIEGASRQLRCGDGMDSRAMDRRILDCILTGAEALQAFELLGAMVFHAPRKCPAQSGLWPYGISGDFPIAAWTVRDEAEVEQGLKWLGCHKLLSRSGYCFDLVLLVDEGGDYRRPARSKLLDGLKALCWEHVLGGRGGIHVVDRADSVLAYATVQLEKQWPSYVYVKRDEQVKPFTLKTGVPDWEHSPDGGFCFVAGHRLPPVGWSQMLTNGQMGWMVDETGCGHLWLDNAREHQITPWCNDPLAVGGPEWLYLQEGDRLHSLFADGDGADCSVTYVPGFARWQKQCCDRTITTTAFVPHERNVRVLLVTLEGAPCHLIHRIAGRDDRHYTLRDKLALITSPNLEEHIGTDGAAEKWLNRTVMHWNRSVSALKVYTPDQAMNRYLNGWALYQVIACRLLGRTSRYQNGGAYGFRDQLQDVGATLLLRGDLAREHLLKACAHQFEEGDVQHWWHEPDGKGVRTRISDDLLFLPLVLCDYLDMRGDETILEERVPYLSAPPLRTGEQERYQQPTVSEKGDTVYRHGVQAVECSLARGTGIHGLARIGCGDWNDGMNRVGVEGRGESVWLTWFTAYVLERFAKICERNGEGERGEYYRSVAKKYTQAANAAWDGEWFLRGWYDNGAPLGSHHSDECQIDSIAQSFSALPEHGDKALARRGIASALHQLFDRQAKVVKLFTPAFDEGENDPGYIKGYMPGVRENGGQYTHAAVWLALGCLRLGMAGEGYDILNALLPEGHEPDRYKAEPYVLAADVYANPAHLGRGGWSWYTGAAGWYYRVAMEELLGFSLQRGNLFIAPRLPETWPGFTAVWRMEQAILHISVRRGEKKGTLLNGVSVQEGVKLNGITGECTMEVTI